MSQDTQQRPVSPRGSATPLISSEQREAAQQSDVVDSATTEDRDPKTGKRRWLGLGKKKEDKPVQKDMASSASPSPLAGDTSLKPQTQPIPISPSRNAYHSPLMAASPSRLRSASPRLHSPASSEIFERNVQEPVPIDAVDELPAHIPAHVITEDHIPPALEATAEAITSEDLNPDEVEIVMSASHQPAASVLESSASHADLSRLNSPMSPLHHVRSDESEYSHSSITSPTAEEDGASNYGQLDPTDVRRLSFISFADVVQSEHQPPPSATLSEAGHRDSLHLSSLPGSFKQDRAASPFRSPRSTTSTAGGGITTPPPGMTIVSTHLEQSPPRSASIITPVTSHGELTIETMRQAVRKTASGDLGTGRSSGLSPTSDEHLASAPRSRTNS